MAALISTNQMAAFWRERRREASWQASSAPHSRSQHSPIAMKRDGNFRANNDENVAVESLSTYIEDKFLLMYEIKIQDWHTFDLLKSESFLDSFMRISKFLESFGRFA